jgi:hypothetical protein
MTKPHKLTFIVLLLSLMTACRHQPKPYQIKLAGYVIQFPVTSKELHRRYPQAAESLSNRLTDTTKSVQIVWRFNDFVHDTKSQPYGVVITLKNKSYAIDSIRTKLEGLCQQPFKPLTMPRYMNKLEYYEPDPSLSVMQINDDVQISINKRKIWPDGGYQFTNDVVISICYNLDAEQKERFAMKQGDIHPDD